MNRAKFSQDENRSIVIALVGLVVVSIATLVLAAAGLSGLSNTNRDLDKSYHLNQQLTTFFDSLQDAETGQRGYVVTGNSSYLEPYNQGVAGLPARLAALKTAASGTAYTQQINQLDGLSRAKLAEMKQVIGVRQSQGFDAAATQIDTGRGKALMDQLRQTVGQVQTSQLAYEDQQRAHASSFAVFTGTVIYLAILGVLVLVSAVYWLYRRAIAARQELDRAKDEFVALASHQLRTPATGIKSILSMLSQEDFGTLNDRQQYFMGKAIESNKREINIIEELLNVAKADAGRLVLHPSLVNLCQVVDAIVGEQQRVLDAKRLHLSVHRPERPLTLLADQEKLYMALGNLLDNACKYTPEDGNIAIAILQRRGAVAVEVADSGIGIAEGEIGRVFDRFQRASNAVAAPIEGTGLGLYLARRIVELHNGTIEVDSKPGQGSRFTMILPLRRV